METSLHRQLKAVYAPAAAREVRVDGYRIDAVVDGELIEIQGSAEGRPFTRAQTDQMLDVAGVAIQKLVGLQRSALDVDGGSTQLA